MVSLTITHERLHEDRFLLIAAAAFASHLFFFRLVELWPIQLAKLYSTVFLLLLAFRHFYSASGLFSSVTSTIVDLTAYTFFLFLSISIYRLFFHRISHIPGP